MSDAPQQQEAQTDTLALHAIRHIKTGMVVGLGSGSTAARGIRALAQHVIDTKTDIKCVAASERAEDLARSLGLKVIDAAMTEELDVLIDGADEVDRNMVVLKGSRGAMTRERILCWAARQTVFMVGADKVSEPQVGAKFPLPIAVMAYGLCTSRRALRHIGLSGVLRQDHNGQLFLTDNGNLVLDCALSPEEDLHELAAEINCIPGVIDHGLFLDEADTILIEHDDGSVETLERKPAAST